MKIAIVVFTDIPDGGPVAHRVLMLSKGLVSWGHEVHILAPYKFSPGALEGEIDGVQIHWGAHIPRKFAETWAGKVRKRFLLYHSLNLLMKQKVDWLIVYDMGLDGLPFLWLARRHKCWIAADNCDIYFHTFKGSLKGKFKRILYYLSDIFLTPKFDLHFAISTFIENQLRTIAPRVPTLIVRAPVDIQKFCSREGEASAWRRRTGIQDFIVIGYFGSVLAVKGLRVLLEAVKILSETNDSFRLLITGRAAGDASTLRLLAKLQLQERVILTGYLTHRELLSAMSAADILVEPKIDDDENRAAFPQKVVEYLSMGKAVVAPVIGDLPLYLEDKENAIFYRAGDSRSLAQALEKLLQNEPLRKKLGKKARETAVKYFDCQKIAGLINDKFLEIEKNHVD